MDAARNERLEIREVVENWVVWRDAGDWERFAGVWHDDGVMMATWFQMPAREFIRVSLGRFPQGYRHLAYAQTRIGYQVKRDMPGLKGPEVEALYARGRAWLAGGSAG